MIEFLFSQMMRDFSGMVREVFYLMEEFPQTMSGLFYLTGVFS